MEVTPSSRISGRGDRGLAHVPAAQMAEGHGVLGGEGLTGHGGAQAVPRVGSADLLQQVLITLLRRGRALPNVLEVRPWGHRHGQPNDNCGNCQGVSCLDGYHLR